MGEMSGSNSPQWRREALSLQKDKWRTLWLSLPAPQIQNHGANRRASFLTPDYARGSSSTAMPAQPRDLMRKTGQKKAPSPGEAILQGKKKAPCPNKTRSNFHMVFFWFGPLQPPLHSLLMAPGKISNYMAHAPNLMNSMSSTSVFVVVSAF